MYRLQIGKSNKRRTNHIYLGETTVGTRIVAGKLRAVAGIRLVISILQHTYKTCNTKSETIH